MILSVCDIKEVAKIMKIIKVVIDIIRVAVPIILIVVSMLDFMKVVTSGDNDALPKTLTHFVERAIAAILVFLIPTFVSLVFFITGAEEEYKKCFGYETLNSNNKLVYVENK